MENDKFKVRCYRKAELAHFYFPELESNSAVQKMMRWVKKCKGLSEALEVGDYNVKNQWLSAQEVKLIVEHLGTP